METNNNCLQKILIGLISIYRYCFSPYFGGYCRFYPTCSQYALSAILSLGFWKGSVLMIRRLLRCHPFCCGGYDPVPQKTNIK